jgi:type I restriction enzyme S subunit
MVSNNPFTKLKDICVKITKGSTPTKKDGGFAERGINFIKAESSSYDGVFDDSKFTFVTEEVYEKYKRSQLEKNDILFSMAGAYLGKTGFVEKKHLPANTNQALALIRVDSTLANPKFVLYCLQQRRVVHFVNNSISQSAQPNINLQQIGDLDIDFPDRKVQDSIVNIIDSIVQRSLNNHYTNQTLEQMAQALFKSWFVDFDPVIDNALSAGTNVSDFPEALQQRAELRKQAQQLPDFKALPDDIHSLFPSEFEQTDEPSIGVASWIPKGWGFKFLYDLGEFINGAAYKKFEPNQNREGLPIVKIAELKSGITSNTGFSTVDMPNKYHLKDQDILFSWSGNPDTSIDTFVWALGDAWLNQHIFKVVPNELSNYAFLFSLLKYLKPEFTAIARDKQTTGLGHVTVKNLKELNVVMPSNELMNIFDKQLSPILERMFLNMKNTQLMEKQRDTLLPKLISGELTIPDSMKTENIVNHQQPKESLSHHA